MDWTDEWIEVQVDQLFSICPALNIAKNGAFHNPEIIQTQQNLTIIAAWTFEPTMSQRGGWSGLPQGPAVCINNYFDKNVVW